jgi:hypothetical protein
METVIEEYSTEEQRFVFRLLWAKGLNAKDVHKEIFPANDGKILLHRAVHKCVGKSCQGRSKVGDDDRPGAEVAETTVKIFVRCVFRKRWDKCINVVGG